MAFCCGSQDGLSQWESHLRKETVGHKGLIIPLDLDHAIEMAEGAATLKPVSPPGLLQTEAARGLAAGCWAMVVQVPIKPWLTQGNRITCRGAMLRAKVRQGGAMP